MRILAVNKFFHPKGGSERVFFDLSAAYEAAGHEVVPFAMTAPGNRASPWDRHFAPEVSWGGSPLRQLRTAASVVYSPEARDRLRGLLREARPDVAHLHNFHHQLSPSILDALREAGVPAVHTLHDYKLLCPNYLLYTEGAVCERCRGGRYLNAVRHRCVRDSLGASLVAAVEAGWHRSRGTLRRGVRRFVAPSRFLRDKLVEFGFDASSIEVIPNGIDASAFPASSPDGDGFVFAGRLAREKGVATLVDAVAAAPALRLTVCGTGPLEAELRDRAEARAPGRIEFTGHLDRVALLRRVAGARAVVIPSEWYENAPVSVLEAHAMGRPVVASRIGGLPEMVREGESGVLCPPGDAVALGAAMRQLQEDPGLAARLGAAGRRQVEREFSLERQAERMLELLGEVASSASR